MNSEPPEPSAAIPGHIAIVMDGNGRWAQQRGQRRNAGHRAGVTAAREAVETCARRGVKVLTLFAFSSENWNRPESEVGLLMSLFVEALGREVKELNKQDIALKFIGDRSRLSSRLQQKIEASETLTANNSAMQLFVAVSYGGRWDIAQAVKQLAEDVRDGNIEVEGISEELLHERMALASVPDPDFFIRTGGEHRISNFLLWNLAYTELYFTDTLWPDFDSKEIDLALTIFANRQRRFGKTGRQVEAAS